MTLLEAIEQRHSIRAYQKRPLEADVVAALQAVIDECNAASGLRIQLITDDPKAFGTSLLAHYGKFRNADHYIAIVGDKRLPGLDELTGYYGERIVLEAQRMGLNTCWVALTYRTNRDRVDIRDDEKLTCVISIGYGVNPEGAPHRIKRIDQVAKSLLPGGEMPDWFVAGVNAALLAPTAINQQKFRFTLQADGRTVVAEESAWGPYSTIDLGIVKLHFEIGSGVKLMHNS